MTNTELTIQLADIGMKRPYPIRTSNDGKGGPSIVFAGRNDAKYLIGFTAPGTQSVDILAKDATPENVIGLEPVFLDFEGGMFSVELPVISAK